MRSITPIDERFLVAAPLGMTGAGRTVLRPETDFPSRHSSRRMETTRASDVKPAGWQRYEMTCVFCLGH
jgi:hypothetical protein